MASHGPTRAEMLRYLSELRDTEASYHDHKETVAWSSIVLYLTAIAAVALKSHKLAVAGELLATVAILLSAALIVLYARAQLSLREYAARIVWGCDRLLLRVLSHDVTPEGTRRGGATAETTHGANRSDDQRATQRPLERLDPSPDAPCERGRRPLAADPDRRDGPTARGPSNTRIRTPHIRDCRTRHPDRDRRHVGGMIVHLKE